LSGDSGSEFAEVQLKEWRRVNSELLQALLTLANITNTKRLTEELHGLVERFHQEWRGTEVEVRDRQRELVSAAENGDFVRSALLSQQLVTLKARTQAAQAVYHETSGLTRNRVVKEPVEVQPMVDTEIDFGEELAAPEPKIALGQSSSKVLPWRRRG
jgi:hypothetical protein